MRSAPAPHAAPREGALGGLLKHSAIYSAAPLLRQLISFGMTRLYTGWLQPAGYGAKETIDTWLIALQQLLGQNVLSGMMRFYFDHERPERRARVVTSCTILIGAVAWLVCAPALLAGDRLVPLLFGPSAEISTDELAAVVRLALLLIPFQLCTQAGYYYLYILKRSRLFTTIQTAKFLLETVLNFVLIGGLGYGVRGFLLSMLCGEALASIGLVGWMLVTLRPRFEWKILRPLLAYALPLIPVSVCQMALHQADRPLIGHFAPAAVALTMTGIYGLGYKIAQLVLVLVISPIMQVWHPFVFGVQDPEERSRAVARFSTYCVLAVAAFSLGVILFGRQGAVLLGDGPDFWEAYRVIPWIAAGYVFWGLYKVSELPLLVAKRTSRLFGINLLAAVVNVAGNVLLIPRLGFVGAGVMTLVTFACLAASGMVASRSEAHVPFELGRLTGIVACVLVGAAVALGVDTLDARGALSVPASLALKLVALGLLGALLWAGVLHADERRRFRDWLAARLRRTA